MRDYSDDIKRYLSGEMSPAERHALEREALNDPFLAEALEGAEALPAGQFAADLRKINRHITAKRRWKPIRAAAVIVALALAAFGLITLWPELNDKPAPLALEQPPVVQAPAPDPAIEREKEPSAVSDRQKVTEHVTGRSKTLSVTDEALALQEKAKKDPALPAGEAKTEQPLAFTEKQAEEPPAVAMLREEAEAVTSQSAAAEPETAKARKAMPSAAHHQPAVPDGGMEAFNRYLRQSQRYPQEAVEKKIEGLVVVQFVVEADGAVGQIKVIHGIGGGCDEELIRLIREGPRWIPAHQDGKNVPDTVQVQLRFSLRQ
ncbi:MAG: cell envelope biogenesis protein TonB [Cyclobacteriaceae bacterium]|nr:MAG: cell envelope biogenesis protein TonB [Cyclobacteriaceae bacterium]